LWNKVIHISNLAITLGASFIGICIICDTSKLKGNPSLERTVIVHKFYQGCVIQFLHLKTKLVVGTISILLYLLIGYLPGPSGSAQTPFLSTY
jgi:hypothetical protein